MSDHRPAGNVVVEVFGRTDVGRTRERPPAGALSPDARRTVADPGAERAASDRGTGEVAIALAAAVTLSMPMAGACSSSKSRPNSAALP